MQTDPIAFFLTWPTYGTWLPGDQRGWVEYQHGWQLPDPPRVLIAQSRMKESACVLDRAARNVFCGQVHETCQYRKWTLYAVDCRSNHIHIVVGAHDTDPRKIRIDIKAWCTRRLKQQIDPGRLNWWAERGSIRYVWNEVQLSRVVKYVNGAQDRKDRDQQETQIKIGKS
ncbi:MAG: transposase [Planctomycetota bacterium]